VGSNPTLSVPNKRDRIDATDSGMSGNACKVMRVSCQVMSVLWALCKAGASGLIQRFYGKGLFGAVIIACTLDISTG
jgi:hypothetical protein